MAINRLDHAALRVEDLDEAMDWYVGLLGMTVLERDPSRALLACRGSAADLTLMTGGRGLHSFAFGVDHLADLDLAERSLSAHGIAVRRQRGVDRPGVQELIGFDLPSAHRMELVVGADGRRAGVTDMRSDGTHRPSDIDHINFCGEDDPEAISAFFITVLGFKPSLALTVQGQCVASWLRSSRLDHDIAFMNSGRPGDRLHHVAFAMEDGNHYFRLGDRFAQTGHRFEFGPGRHMARARETTGFGANLFAYAFDPSGNRNEFSAGMDEMADDESQVSELGDNSLADVMNGWARNMPDSFMTQGS